MLLLDYGGVLSQPFPEATLGPLADRLRVDRDLLTRRFWAGRVEFDRGQAAADYWAEVCGRPLSAAELAAATATDLDGWGHLHPDAVVATRRAADHGLRLALLSNMPHTEADAYEQRSWAEPFERLFFSCRLGVVKPDPAIFRHVIAELGVTPAEITFLDDRADNVDAARQLGIDARRCDGGAQLAGYVETLL